ncbi:MAG: CPBP family intramembrane metalloprotease [Planctomycetota bacterium]|nr:CPBP family intramembrane metalloprotease [Planctomycetota bacterium]
MMSNALSVLTGPWAQLAAGARSPANGAANSLAAVGCCVLAGWAAVRFARPGKLQLLRTPRRPNRIDVTVLGLLFIGWLALGLAGAGLARWALEAGPPPASAPASAPASPEKDPRLNVLTGLIAYPLQLVLCLSVAGSLFRGGVTRGLGLSFRRWPNDLVRALVAGLAVWPVSMGLYGLITYLMPALAQHPHPLLDFAPKASGLWQSLIFLSAALLAPLTEEVFFRGFIQSTLRRITVSPWLAITITSVLFGLMHVVDQPAAVPSLVILGMVLGYNYERTGRLLAPILLHVFFLPQHPGPRGEFTPRRAWCHASPRSGEACQRGAPRRRHASLLRGEAWHPILGDRGARWT